MSGEAPATRCDDACRYGAKSPCKFAGAVAGSIACGAEVECAVEELRASFAAEKTLSREWRAGQLRAFRRMLVDGADELCQAIHADLRKSCFEGFATEVAQVIGEVDEALAHLDEWLRPTYTDSSAMNVPCWSYTQRDPLGLVLILGAWNYPAMLTLGPIVGAIAGGNCVLVKPGSYAPHSSNAIARLIAKYLDGECIRVAEGDRTITTALLEQRFDKICFTGSGFVGKKVLGAAAKHLTPCLLELGGKSPCIVDKSASLRHAARRLVWGSFLNAGQTCVRPDFVLVHEAVAEEFFALVKEALLQFYGADPQRSEWLGRCVNDAAFQRLQRLLNGPCAQGKLFVGGGADASDRYVEPTVLDYGSDLAAFMRCAAMQDEIFGPILPAARFSSLEQVVALIKGLPTGKPLALYCFAQDAAFIDAIRRRTTSGALDINDSMMQLANTELPFGGVGASGMGAYHGKHTFEAFTHEKAVLEKSQWLDNLLAPVLDLRFPPYTPMKQVAVKLLSVRIATVAVNVHRRKGFWVAIICWILWRLGFRITRKG